MGTSGRPPRPAGAAAPAPTPSIEEQIAQALRDSEASGELRGAPSWGRPLADNDAEQATPQALRMPYKILKNAGIVPPEVQAFAELGRLREALAAAADPVEAAALRQRIVDLEQRLALRLEGLRRHGSV